MRWSGALTLGAVLILGDGAGVQGQDLPSSVDAASTAAGFPSWGGLRPALPENWSDLPVRFHVSESLGYNSNVNGVPTGTTIYGPALGDFVSNSSYGVSATAPWEGEQFFLNASGGMSRYLHNPRLDTNNYSANAGVNWIYTSQCSGTLVASATENPYNLAQPQSQAQTSSNLGQTVPGQPVTPITNPALARQVGFGFINVVTTTSLNESATCHLSHDYSAILNSGYATSSNSTAPNKPNDYQDIFVAAGISYSVAQTNSLQALVTLTSTDYTNRGAALTALGLSGHTDQLSFNLTYTKQFDPNFSMTASIGFVGVNNKGGNGLFSLALPSGFLPQYSLSANWAATPKLSFTASAGQSVAPPQSIIGNAQVNRTVSLGMSYPITPKLSFSASAAVGQATGAFTPTSAVTNAVLNSGAEKTYAASAGLSYAMTPFLGANLSYSYSRTDQARLITPQSAVILAVNYAPY